MPFTLFWLKTFNNLYTEENFLKVTMTVYTKLKGSIRSDSVSFSAKNKW